MKTLLLVDGSSYLYRAFHALPDFRNTPSSAALPDGFKNPDALTAPAELGVGFFEAVRRSTPIQRSEVALQCN